MNPKSNDLLERYLQAIGGYLPAANREDVLAELRANLQAQIDDRSEELSRPLTEAEVAVILKEHGRPVVVAARYLPQQYLIGPAIFPYYVMTLRKATPFILVILFLANCSGLLFAHAAPELIAGILGAMGRVIPNFIYFAAWITVAFGIAEYVHVRNYAKPFGTSWDPTKLPRVTPEVKGKSRAARIADLVLHVLWIAYVLEIPRHPFLILGPSVVWLQTLSVGFAPGWHTYYLLLLALLAIQLVTKIVALDPSLDGWKSALDLVIKVAGVAACAFLVTMKEYFVATSGSANLAKLALVNHSINIAFRIVLIIVVVQAVIDAWKILRPSLRARSLVF